MSYKVDDRGSKDQKILYQYLHDIYKGYEIVYEYPLYELNQRIDIYIPNLALAFEYHGRQHFDFVEHFHKNIEGFKESLRRDQQKREYLLLHGIKLIEIPYNNMVKDKEELLEIIQKTPYPSFSFNPIPTESDSEVSFKEKEKKKRQDKYKESKSFFEEDVDKKKERLEKEKQFRKERYRKMKENK